MKAYRQGEILFFPREIKEVGKLNTMMNEHPHITVIAEGEAAGHLHEIADKKTAVMIDTKEVWSDIDGHYPRSENFDKLLVANKVTTIKHPEHKDLELPVGTYFVKTQREYDEEMSRRVID